jgi:hypothetical protein
LAARRFPTARTATRESTRCSTPHQARWVRLPAPGASVRVPVHVRVVLMPVAVPLSFAAPHAADVRRRVSFPARSSSRRSTMTRATHRGGTSLTSAPPLASSAAAGWVHSTERWRPVPAATGLAISVLTHVSCRMNPLCLVRSHARAAWRCNLRRCGCTCATPDCVARGGLAARARRQIIYHRTWFDRSCAVTDCQHHFRWPLNGCSCSVARLFTVAWLGRQIG